MMQTIKPAVAYRARNRARDFSTDQSPAMAQEQRIDRIDIAGIGNTLEADSISKLLAVPALLSIGAIRSKVKLDLFKSAAVAVVASIIAIGLQFVSMESAGGYLFGIAITSYLSLHSLAHHSNTRPSSN